MAELTVVSWSEDDVPEGASRTGWWGGFFENGMRWKDYVENFDAEVRPYLEAARASAVENGIKVTGADHQHRGITPVLSDGRYFAMTYRAWGDFMAAGWSEEESRDFSYMDFYS
jgi:hypothetical protein